MKKDFKEKFLMFFKKVGNGFANLLFPDNIKCFFCGDDVPDFENKPFCDGCEKKISFNNKKRCLVCSEPIDDDKVVCDECKKTKRYFKRAFCPFVYEGLVRKVILAYKDSNERYRAKTFAKFMAEDIKKSGVKIDVITFVPMTKKKQRKRSFNQAELLAKKLGEILGVEVVPLLKKVRDEKSQKFSSYSERQKNINGLYALLDIPSHKDKTILLVDDIITTCATVNFCSMLLSQKFKEVYVCAIARNRLRKNKDVEF